MEDCKKVVEAVLFTTGRFMDVEEISRLCGIGSVGIVKDVLGHLKGDYDGRDTALMLMSENEKFKLGIRREYNYLTTSLISDSELDGPTTKTLALIAYKQPVMQSDIIDMRGNTAYDHIKLLREQGFILSEKRGRTRLLKLATKFFDYFDIVENELRNKIVSKDAETIINETGAMEESLKDKNSSQGSTDNIGSGEVGKKEEKYGDKGT